MHSQVKPKVSKRIRAGFDENLAIIGAGAAAEKLNEEYGDNIDPRQAVAAVKQFLEKSGADLKCRSCGWAKGGKCTQHFHTIDPGGTCDLYRHVLNVVRSEAS